MQRYVVRQFDGSTFVVIDQKEQREICVCSEHDEQEATKKRAERIAKLLNASDSF